MLRIQLFGLPTIYDNERPLLIKRKTTRALLFYLAGIARPVTREHLMDRFWPDLPLDKQRTALRDNLGKLRVSLPDKSILFTSLEVVSLDSCKVWVDLFEMQTRLFSINLNVWKLPEDQPLPAALYNQIVEAVRLWSGQRFLPGGELSFSVELDEWAQTTEQRVTDDFVRVVKRLARHDSGAGNPEQAIKWLWLALPFAELDSALHQAILENYLQNDSLHVALAYYQNLTAFFGSDEEYPSNLRAFEARLSAPARGSLPNLPADWAIRQSLQVPFVGQNELLENLKRAYRVGGGVLIFGETGVGKTRLVQEFYRRQSDAPRLMLAACQPLEASIPFSPWIKLLRSSVFHDEWKKLDLAWARPLTLLLPDLSEIRPELANTSVENAEISRAVLMDAIHQILLIVSNTRHIILFLDDVHWADESTLAVVAYLLRKEFFTLGRGMLVTASRIEERNPLLDKLLLTSYPQPLRRFELRNLNLDEVTELSAQVLTRALPCALVKRLEQDTGGNPFFLLEILALLQQTVPAENLANVTDLPLPGSISELIRARLSALSPAAQDLLSLAAVMGSPFEVQPIEHALPLTPEMLARAFEELEQARLLRTVASDIPGYAFVHEKIRESLLQELSAPRKRLMHQTCATALENYLGAGSDPAASKLARHFDLAGNFPKAFDYWLSAGRHARRVASDYECVQAYHQAEQLIPRAPSLTEQQIYALYAAWIDIAFESDDSAELERIAQVLLVLGQERASDLLIGTSYGCLSNVHVARNRLSDALRESQASYPYVMRSGNEHEIVRMCLRHGVYLYMLGNVSESQEWLQKAREKIAASGDPHQIEARAGVYYQLAMIDTMAGFPLRGLEHGQLSLNDYISAHRAYGQTSAYFVLGLAYYTIRNYEAGREACLKGLALKDRVEGWLMIGYLFAICGGTEVELGLLGQAWGHAQEALEIGKKYEHSEIIGMGCRILGDIYLRLLDYEKAAAAYKQGIDIAGEHMVRLENQYRYGYCLLKMGQDIGYRYIEQPLADAEKNGLDNIILYAVIYQLRAFLTKGDLSAFEQRAAWFCEQIRLRIGKDWAPNIILRLRAWYFCHRGDFELALTTIDEVFPQFQGGSFLWDRLECLNAQVVAQNQLGLDTTASHQQITEILDQIQSNLGDAPLQAEFQACRQKYTGQLL